MLAYVIKYCIFHFDVQSLYSHNLSKWQTGAIALPPAEVARERCLLLFRAKPPLPKKLGMASL